MRTLHLFAGAGGGLLADLILGHTPVAAVEWDAYCCAVLRERAAEGWFPGLIVHQCDVREFDPAEYTGRVDAIHAGFPCQDISSAGKGAGISEGTRSGLWSEVVRCARVLRPDYLFLENVAAITGNGLDRVLADLAALGLDARWDCVSAAAVGAPHGRDRWWCVAYANDSGRGRLEERDCQEEAGKQTSRRRDVDGLDMADVWTWASTPRLFRMDYGMAPEVQRLKCIGNGQVPLQAAYAFQGLMP